MHIMITACTLEFLLKFQSLLKTLPPEAVGELVLAEVKRVDEEALLRIGSAGDDADNNEISDAKSCAYMLHKEMGDLCMWM